MPLVIGTYEEANYGTWSQAEDGLWERTILHLDGTRTLKAVSGESPTERAARVRASAASSSDVASDALSR